MTARILFLITAALCITGASIHAQQAFQNLNFESANPVIVQNSPYYPNVVTAASALPDWTVTIGGVAQSQVFYNDPSTGSTWVMLAGPGTDYFGVKPIDGSYSVLLQGGGTASAAAISQTELIPAGTQYLMFDASQPANGSGPLDVLINNESLPFTVVGTGPNYTLYIANISAWAGLTEQLTFSVPESAQPNNWEIDDISFSPTPEPDPLILTGIAGLIFALHRRFQKQ